MFCVQKSPLWKIEVPLGGAKCLKEVNNQLYEHMELIGNAFF